MNLKQARMNFYKNFETPPSEDDLTLFGVWRQYVEPRFKWIKSIIDVEDQTCPKSVFRVSPAQG
jgi:hypothetical protein